MAGRTKYRMGIKTLSLFFIDEVAYRQYDEDGNEQLGEYGKMFEEEYFDILNQYLTLENTPYQQLWRGRTKELRPPLVGEACWI